MDKMVEQISEADAVVSSLGEIQEDLTVPRNVRTKIQSIIAMLKADLEFSIRISKALNELAEVVDDVNLQSYTRTQIYNAMTTLEKIQLN